MNCAPSTTSFLSSTVSVYFPVPGTVTADSTRCENSANGGDGTPKHQGRSLSNARPSARQRRLQRTKAASVICYKFDREAEPLISKKATKAIIQYCLECARTLSKDHYTSAVTFSHDTMFTSSVWNLLVSHTKGIT